MDPNAILAFGYDLGAHGKAKLKEYDKFFGLPDVAWYDRGPENYSFIEQAENCLLTAAGVEFTESADLDPLLKQHLGVWFERYGWDGEPNYVLTGYVLEASWDDTKPIDFAELNKQAVQHRLDTKLADALDTLGITPTQQRPTWLLCAFSC
jgi:hypothetical protein